MNLNNYTAEQFNALPKWAQENLIELENRAMKEAISSKPDEQGAKRKIEDYLGKTLTIQTSTGKVTAINGEPTEHSQRPATTPEFDDDAANHEGNPQDYGDN